MKNKKLGLCLVMLLIFSLTLTACGGQEAPPAEESKQVAVFGDNSVDTKKEESVEAEPSSEEATSEEESQVVESTPAEESSEAEEVPVVGVPTITGDAPQASETVMRSLMQTGNNYRLKKAIEKAKSGEEVVIAYIGGSITEGANATPNKNCYAYRSYEYFKETFAAGGNNVKFVNAGMSGTPSTIGMIRYDRDVVQKVGEPDILFVEFAVNDGDDPTNGVCFESLVLNALQSESQPAVVLLFSVFKSQWNLQDRLAPVGKHYDLPMISIKDAVVPALQSGELTEAEFFSDVYHPTNEGHQLMADCINYMFDVVNYEEASATDITIPDSPKIGNAFVGVKLIDSTTNDPNVTITPGCFSGTDNAVGSFSHSTNERTFPNNWLKTSTATGDSFKMELTCKNLVLLYKSSNTQTYGKADVYVDGEKVATLNGYAASGWNNPLLKILFNKKESEKHTIEIKMAEGSEGSAFTIMGFGYTE